ncbi:MAG: sortase [Bacilli bacterium]
MRKLGIFLVIIGIAILGFYLIYNKAINKRAHDNVDDYINNTSIVNEVEIENNIEEQIEEKETSSKSINYTAIIEIPTINLKQGVVDSTDNFNSINYAISVDKNSNYPNELGNFILYAHSGNSNIAYFKNLNKVNISDEVYVYYNGVKYHYVIENKYDIEKTGKAKVINLKDNRYITLITCNQDRKGYQIVVEGKLMDSTTY